MKKLLAFLLALTMLLCISACSAPEDTDTGSKTPGGNQAGNEDTSDEISFEELSVVDNDHCVITITGIDPENIFGYGLNVYLENKSADKTYMFSVSSAAINGVTADPFFATEVAAGKKSNETITFVDDELAATIGTYTDIQLSFRVYDSNDWTADPVAETTVHVYPYGQENATVYTREAQLTDTVLVDNDKVTVISTGYETDPILGYVMNVYLVNKTDMNVMFAAEDVSVNGYMADPYYANSVGAGNCAFGQICWTDTTFAENNITSVETIEMTIRAYNADDWLADDFAKETVTLNP